MPTLCEAAWARLWQLAACSLGYFLRDDKGANPVIAAGQVAPRIALRSPDAPKMPTPAGEGRRQTGQARAATLAFHPHTEPA